MRSFRIVFAGTPEFACPSLAALHQAGHEVALVLTQPDRPRGRGHRPAAPAVKTEAERLGLTVAQPEQVDATALQVRLAAIAPDVVVVVAFGQKIPAWFLALPLHGCVNAHASLLPRYRGADPIRRAIVNGDEETGVSIMILDEGWDTGPVLCQRRVRIEPDENAGSLYDRLALVGADLIVLVMEGMAGGVLKPVDQDEALATHAPRMRAEEVRLDWSRPARDLHNLVRALAPAPAAETYHGAERLQVVKTQALETVEPAIPGTVLAIDREGVIVAAGVGALRMLQVKPPGGRLMPAAAYARGHHLLPGVRLG